MGIYVGFGLSVMLLPSHIHTHTRNSPFFQFELRQPSPERDVLDVYIYIQHNYIEHEWNIMQHQRRSWAAELLRIAGGEKAVVLCMNTDIKKSASCCCFHI